MVLLIFCGAERCQVHRTMQDLVDLSDADLKELGITSMGHRKLILRTAAQSSASLTEEVVDESPESKSEAPPSDARKSTTGAAEHLPSSDGTLHRDLSINQDGLAAPRHDTRVFLPESRS